MEWNYTKENIQNIYPLSLMQSGMYVEHLLGQEEGAYVQQITFDITGDFDIDQYKNALEQLVDRHDVLRTVYVQKKDGKLLQVVLKEVPVSFKVTDLSGLEDKALIHYTQAERKQTFDLSKGPLFRPSVIKREQGYTICFTYHHIILDGWSVFRIFSELTLLYEQNTALLPAIEPFSKYIGQLAQKDHEHSLQYWKDYLADFTQSSVIPRKAKTTSATNRNVERLVFGSQQKEQIDEYLRGNKVTTYNFIMTCWSYVLAAFNNQDDVILGTVISGRDHQMNGIENVVGVTLNCIPRRFRFQPDVLFSHMLEQVQQDYLESLEHAHVPLSSIQALTKQNNELFDHLLIFENIQWSDVNTKTPSGDQYKIDNVSTVEYTHYNLDITVYPGQELIIEFVYDQQNIDEEFIKAITEALKKVISTAVSSPAIMIKDLLSSSFAVTYEEMPAIDSF